MSKYGYKSWLGGILAGSLIAAPAAFAHGGRYSSSEDMSQSYAWNGDTTPSDQNSFAPTNEESPQFSNDPNPAPTPQSYPEEFQTAINRLRQDRDKLQQDLNSGASDDQIAQDQRALMMDQQSAQDKLSSDYVTVPGS